MIKDDIARAASGVRTFVDKHGMRYVEPAQVASATPSTDGEFKLWRSAGKQATALGPTAQLFAYVLIAILVIGVFYLLLRFGDSMINWFANFGR